MKEEQNLTTGNVTKKLIAFALPLLFANLLQSFYSVADMLVVGRIVGEIGLAAISNASMISFVLNSICLGIAMGATVLIAQFQGANNTKEQQETAGTLFFITLILSVIITAAVLGSYAFLFDRMQLPSDVMQDACEYMKVICYGTIFVFGFHAVCSILKGAGDSKNPLYFIGIATVINVVLDFLLVGFFHMGTKGSAYATVFSQGISFSLSIFHLKRKSFFLDFKIKQFAVKKDKLILILKIGLPTAIQMVIVNLSYLFITGMLNQFGIAVIAASGIGLKINTIAGMPCWAVGQAVTAMAGQNAGANNIKRIRETTKTGLYLNFLITFALVILVQIFAKPLILLFHPKSEAVVIHGIWYLRICCGVNSLIYAAMYTFDSFAIGIGSSHLAMVNSLLDAAVVRLSVSWLLAFFFCFDFFGIYIGQALSPVLPALIGFFYFKSKIWEKKNEKRQTKKEKQEGRKRYEQK